MKQLIIAFLIALLSLVACKKEEPDNTHITGIVYEAGTNYPVRNADVAMIQYNYSNRALTVVSTTKCDENGKYSLENKYQIDGHSYYIMADAFDYYEQEFTNIGKQRIDARVSTYNVQLYRKAKLAFHIQSVAPFNSGDQITISTPRLGPTIFEYYSFDSIVFLPVNGASLNKIGIQTTQNNITTHYDTLFDMTIIRNEPIQLTY